MLLPRRFKRKNANDVDTTFSSREEMHFFEEGYTMKEKYSADTLIVSNLTYIPSEEIDQKVMSKTTQLKYFFEPIVENGKTRYREIFTGFIADDEPSYFNLPYIEKKKGLFTDYFSNMKGQMIPNLSLLLYLDEINEVKKEKEYRKKKN